MRELGNGRQNLQISQPNPPPGGDSNMEQKGMLVGNFEFNP